MAHGDEEARLRDRLVVMFFSLLCGQGLHAWDTVRQQLHADPNTEEYAFNFDGDSPGWTLERRGTTVKVESKWEFPKVGLGTEETTRAGIDTASSTPLTT